MAIVFWDPQAITEGTVYQDNPWDTAWLDSMQIPGLVQVSCQPVREVDKKKPHGGNGMKMTIQGYLPSEVVLRVLIWTPDQWTAWQKIAPVIWPRGSKPAAGAFKIKHPETGLWGINSIYVISPSSSVKGPVEQSRLWTLKCLEYLPVKKKTATKDVTPDPVGLAPSFVPGTKNATPAPPSKTDTGPGGTSGKPPASGGF